MQKEDYILNTPVVVQVPVYLDIQSTYSQHQFHAKLTIPYSIFVKIFNMAWHWRTTVCFVVHPAALHL